MDRPEHSASEIASQDRRLSALMRAAKAFEALDARIQPALSERARGQVRVACVDGDTLVLSAASAAWATLARLEAKAFRPRFPMRSTWSAMSSRRKRSEFSSRGSTN